MWQALRRPGAGPTAEARWWLGRPPPCAWTSPARYQQVDIGEAVACPPGIQISKNKHVWPLLQIGHLLGLCSHKATPSIRLYGHVLAVGRRLCSSSRIGGGDCWRQCRGLFRRPKWSPAPPPHKQQENFVKKLPGVCIYEAIYVDPHPLCSTRQGGPPLHCWVRRECNCPRWLSGQYWSMLTYMFQHCLRDHWYPRKTLDLMSSVAQKYCWFYISAFRKTTDWLLEP
jgi:hypothetical protein